MRFFPEFLDKYISKNKCTLRELRLRKDKPATANLNGQFVTIDYKGNNVITSSEDINKIVTFACENSVYIYNDCIKRGYVTTKEGIRIGLCGRCVYNNESLVTITDFTSLCVRFPHQILDCSKPIFDLIKTDNDIKSSLILSPPGVGKTTAIRDLARLISNNLHLNILIVDEKNEIYADAFDLGATCDILKGCSKQFGFFSGIKNFSPNVIIVDELIDFKDALGVEFASLSGVSVIATAHAKCFNDAMNKQFLKSFYTKGCFDCYITLSKCEKGFYISEVVNRE